MNEKIESMIISFDRKRESNRRKAFVVKITTVIISALITIFLGIDLLNADLKFLLKNFSLILSASLVVLSTWDSFFNYRELWIRYTDTSNKLKELKTDIFYFCRKPDEEIVEKEIDQFYERFKSILDITNNYWVQSRLKKEQKQEK